MASPYRVMAKYVTLKVVNGPGTVGFQGFYEGAVVDGDQVDEESLKRHLQRGMVEELTESIPPTAEPEPEPQPAADESEPKKPGHNDLKEAWVDYAVAQGYERAEADEMSKADLIDMFK